MKNADKAREAVQSLASMKVCPLDLKPCCDDICHSSGCLRLDGEDMMDLCPECHLTIEDCRCDCDEPPYF